MGLVLAQKNDDVFNLVVSMDVIHNSLTEAVKVLSTDRRALIERLTVEDAEGTVVSGNLDRQQMLTLRPRMIDVNSLSDDLRIRAKKDFDESGVALERLNEVLRDNLGLTYKLESTVKSSDHSTPDQSEDLRDPTS